jgi:cytochrome b561
MTKYSLVLRALHWIITVLILGLLLLGWYMVPYQEGKPVWDQYYYFHKSFGVLVFLLILLRLTTRITSTVPELPRSLPVLDRKLAKAAHVALYLLMVATPLFGYLMSSSYEYSDGVYLFNWFTVPEVLPKSEVGFKVFGWAHAISAYTLLAVIVLHVCGALKHRFFDQNKDNDVLSRML